MEIITMESTAYKELVEKIDRIAGYVRDSERSKKGDGADVWLCNEEVMSLLGISRRTLQRRNASYFPCPFCRHDTQMKRTLKHFRDHTHILFLKIISAKTLGQILTRHLLSCLFFYLLCKFFDRHPFTAQNDLDLFSKR